MERSIDTLPTPALLIDTDIVRANLERAAQTAMRSGKKLRPHIKTHKIPLFAKMQMALGADGICCAKVSEAEVMADAGIRDILIANEVVGEEQLQRLAALSKRVRLGVLVDSEKTIDLLASTAAREKTSFDVMVEVDTGDERCGALPENVPMLAVRVTNCPGLHFTGIETFGGSAFHCQSREEELILVPKLAALMRRVKADVEAAGIPVREVSVGGSPAFELLAQQEGITELRPGVYLFNDAATVSREGARMQDCAVTVLTTVISTPNPHRMVVDGGAKTFSYCRPGVVYGHRILHGVLKDNPAVCLSSLSEEHGVFQSEGDELKKYRVGDKIEVIPAHVCPAVNLFDSAYLCSHGRATDMVVIAARGKMQ